MSARMFPLRARFEKQFEAFSQTTGFVYLCYLALIIFFFGRFFATTYMHADFIAYWVPHYVFVLQSLQAGSLPLWQPYSYLGVPELFKLELVLFYPPTWIVLAINLLFNRGVDINFVGKSLELLQYFNISMGALGMYVLLKKRFAMSQLVAFAGGMIFVISHYMTIQAGDLSSFPGKLFLPWMTFFLLNFLDKQSWKNYTYVVGINFILFTLGYPYNYVYFLLAQLGLAAFFGPKKVVLTLLALGNAALLAGVFLLPNLHVLTQSFRGGAAAVIDPFFHLRNALVPTKIISVINPFALGQLFNSKDPQQLFSLGMLNWGVIPLIFLCLGFTQPKVNKVSTWIVLLFVFGVLISFGGYINAPFLLGLIFPPIEKFRSHLQLLSLTFFAGTVILAQGMESVVQGKKSKRSLFFLWEVAILGMFILLLLPKICHSCSLGVDDFSQSFSRSVIFLFLGLILVQLTLQTKQKIFLVAAVIITLFEAHFYAAQVPYLRMTDSYSDFYRQNTLIPEVSSSQNLFRYQFQDNQFIYNTSFLKVFNAQGYETVPSQAFYALDRFGEEKKLQFTNTKYLVTTESKKEKKLSSLKLVNTLNPIDLPNETFYGSVDDLIYFSPQRKKPYFIYEVQNYLPRFFVPQRVESCSTVDDSCYNNEDPAVRSIIKNTSVSIENPEVHEVKIDVVSYEVNKIVLEVEAPKETFISSSEVWDKGWKLHINGKKETLYNISNGFRGFKVSSGKNTVVMEYSPPYILIGVGVSFAGIIVALCYTYISKLIDFIFKVSKI